MNNLLKDLKAVVLLAEKATPGRLETELTEAYNVRADHGGIFAQIHHLKGQHGLDGRVHGDEAAANARLITAAVNFLRTHHAEIAEAVKDARRIDFLQREVDEIGAFLLHNGIGASKGFTGLGLKNTKRTLRRAIDQCLEAEAIDAHNSAREGGE